MQVTIKDVAKRAGVSQATVSRVMNNYNYVNEKTKKKVLEAIEELNYKPNQVARNFALQKTGTIGLIVPDITNPFYSEIAKSITNRAKLFDYNVILCNNDNKKENQEFYIDFLQQKGVDGIIFASVSVKDELAEKLVKAEYPCVFCNRRLRLKKANFVTSDNKKGAEMVVNHLVERGHTRIGFISGPGEFSTAKERLDGFCETINRYGISSEEDLIKQGPFDKDSAFERTLALLNLAKPPSAIFVSNDVMALASMEAIIEKGYSIPEDVALVGYDDIDISGHININLTTVAQQKEKMGEIAVNNLMGIIGQKKMKPYHTYLEPKLIIRKTT